MTILTSARECRRLDYLGSQEPGDLSQANAIEVVDKLLVEDDTETQIISLDNTSGMKSASMLGAKVARCLAEKVEYSCLFQKAGVFDWADNPQPKNGMCSTVSCGEHETVIKNQVKHSEFQRLNGNRAGTRSWDLLKRIDEEPGLNYLEQQAEPVSAFDGTYDACCIGPDTQMAAEAMEALFNAPAVSYDPREDEHPSSSMTRIFAVKKVETDNASLLHSSVQNMELLAYSSGGMAAESKASKGVCTSLNKENSSSSRSRSSKPTCRGNVKQMVGKTKRSNDNKISPESISHRGSERITVPARDNPCFPHLPDENSLLRPKRKRTQTSASGNPKSNKATRSTSEKDKTAKVMRPATVHGLHLTNHSILPDIMDGVKRKRRTSSTDQKMPAPTSNDASDGTLEITSKDSVLSEVSHLNHVARSLLSIEQGKQSAQGKFQQSSLVHTAPLREISNTLPQFLMQSSGRLSNKGFPKSPCLRELASLVRNGKFSDLQRSARIKRDMSSVRVLFSQHMDQEIIKQQRKILVRFGVPPATSMADATHFIADRFARTRNMLEAMAMGKFVVTSLWLECCGLARCFIDEKKYILRDLKKEKEIGFNMPVSLSHACQNPLLEGRRVLITLNAKPGRELLKILVVAARGQPLERITGPVTKDKNFQGAFAISCEEDYNICLPLIKMGLEVFDSELLLNGIVIQKLQFERHRIFGSKAI